MSVSDELKRKRAELSALAEELAAEMAETQARLGALDKVIAIYDPEWSPEAAGARRTQGAPKGKIVAELDTVLGGTNRRQTALDVLRILGRPSTTAECTRSFGDRFGIPGDDPKMGPLKDVVTKALCGLERSGRVRGVLSGESNRKLWEIAI